MTKPTLDALRMQGPSEIPLSQRPTRIEPIYADKADYRARLDGYRDRIKESQSRFFASNQRALLVLVQGLDASGKNGLIRHAFSGVDPAGMHVWSFAEPSGAELRQDFLRRYQRRLPLRGRIGVFNRSYYEHVLVVRVHPEWLAVRGEADPRELPPAFWHQRFQDINGFERYLVRNGVRVVKLMLHLSHEEQRRRFLARIDDPKKSWKLSAADLRDREYWDEFQQAYAQCLNETATEHAPWHVIPADDKRNARLLGAAIVSRELEAAAGDWPQPSATRQRQLADARRRLEDEGGRR